MPPFGTPEPGGGDPDRQNVALEAGYQSHEAFTRAFKKEFGLPPQAYRRSRPGLEGLAALVLY